MINIVAMADADWVQASLPVGLRGGRVYWDAEA